jgi:low temperature requirement protein LtrA/ketosteroid isomerase-like protein
VSSYVVEGEHRVTPLELFFDLVFVFGFTEVTTLMLDDVTWAGLGRALLVLAVLWWAWASYAWLTNAVDPNAGPVTATVIGAVAAMFVAALAVPEAFGTHRLAFGVAFLVVVLIFVAQYAIAARGEPDLLSAVTRLARWALPAGGLILGAAFVQSGLRPVLWAAAIVIGFVGPSLEGLSGWRVHPAHFAERHGLILIIAIGESLAALGFGARAAGLGAGVIVAAVLGVVIAAAFWLAYFDFSAVAIQRQLVESTGERRTALARDIYTYGHFPMVAGIILFAFGTRTTVAHVHDELRIIPAVALCGGASLYLLAYVGLRFRVSRTLSRGRSVAAVGFAALIPVALAVPALLTLGLVAAVWLGLHAYELIWWREERARRRAEGEPAAAALVPAVNDIEIATRFLEAMSSRDFETAESLLAADAEVTAPDGTLPASEFIRGVREWEGLENLDISVENRVVTEEDGVVVSRSRRVFRWKESGEVAYDQPAEARITIVAGLVTNVEMR